MTDRSRIEIVRFEDEFADAYARLNREWLDAYGLYEDADGLQLYTPRETIIDRGGEIYVALVNGRVVGTCALIRQTAVTFEVAKLAVSRDTRGKGLGRRLTLFAIERSRKLGAQKLTLLSSSKLEAAIQLYESVGFCRMPLPENLRYESADVYMDLELNQDSA